MVYMHFPQNLTEEEELLQKKYAKLKKKKKILAALRAPKPEPKQDNHESGKRSAEAAANAMEQAKKLLKTGAIKLESDKKDGASFKRSRRTKETEKPAVSFQPFSPTQTSDQDEDKSDASRPKGMKMDKTLYDSFIRSEREQRLEPAPAEVDIPILPERRERRMSEREDRREREIDLPKKGNTIYVHGHGLSEELLSKAFLSLGSIVNISMEPDKNCGFVTFEKMESADEAITQMNGIMQSNVKLRVSMARRQPTFDTGTDPSSNSWASIAASQSQKGTHKDKRDLVTYDDDDIF